MHDPQDQKNENIILAVGKTTPYTKNDTLDLIFVNDVLTYDKYKGEDLKVIAVDSILSIICIKIPENFNMKYIKAGTLLFKK